MVALLALTLTGCAPTPASIKFDGEPTATVHTLDAVAVKKATVLDADGKALDPQPAATELSWSVTPATVATLDKTNVKPVGNGDATVEAKIGDVKASYKFVVALPNKIEIAGYTAGTPVAVAATQALTATVMAGADKIDNQTITWESANTGVATVDAKGTVTGVSAGSSTIKATAGALSATVDITVGAAAPAAAVADAKDAKDTKDAKGKPAPADAKAPPAGSKPSGPKPTDAHPAAHPAPKAK